MDYIRRMQEIEQAEEAELVDIPSPGPAGMTQSPLIILVTLFPVSNTTPTPSPPPTAGKVGLIG